MNEQQREAAISELNKHSPDIIKVVKSFFYTRDGKAVFENLKNSNDLDNMGKKQFRMLLSAAETASCADELCLLIQYKAVKVSGWRNPGPDNKKLADRVIECLGQIKTISDNICQKVKMGSPSDQEEVQRLATVKFLGYVCWAAEIATAKENGGHVPCLRK